MNDKALKALRLSIAHWKRLATGNERKGESPRGKNCALCNLFPTCKGCPVAKRTGKNECDDTPYYNARNAWIIRGGKFYPAFHEAAKLELAFLQSLLPKRKTRRKA